MQKTSGRIQHRDTRMELALVYTRIRVCFMHFAVTIVVMIGTQVHAHEMCRASTGIASLDADWTLMGAAYV